MSRVAETAAKLRGISLFGALLWLQVPLLALLLWYGGNQAAEWLNQPLDDVTLTGKLNQSDAANLRRQIWNRIDSRYLDIDLAGIKAELEQNAWVHRVDIRRQWPAGLLVDISEEIPVARWGRNGLLNSEGQIFMPDRQQGFGDLPVLKGPENRTLVMMEQFRSLSQQMRPMKLQLRSLELEPRGAWSLTLDNGIRLLLGRGNLIEKVQRFGRVYGSQLAGYADKIRQIDVRYTNGLTVTWHQPPTGRTG